MWFQRSREEWIVSGDRNKAYYHVAATIRKTRNIVKCLRDGNDIWIGDMDLLKNHVRGYYMNLFSCEGNISNTTTLEGTFPRMTVEDWGVLNSDISKEVVYGALSNTLFKAPGP